MPSVPAYPAPSGEPVSAPSHATQAKSVHVPGFLWVLFGLAASLGSAFVAGVWTAAEIANSSDSYAGLLYLLTPSGGLGSRACRCPRHRRVRGPQRPPAGLITNLLGVDLPDDPNPASCPASGRRLVAGDLSLSVAVGSATLAT